MGPETPHNPNLDDGYQPMALVGVVLIALLGFAVFFLSFLVAPLAILMIFYVGFAASDRSKRNGSSARLANEAEARRHVIERVEEEPPAPAPTLSRAGA
jgi:ABC-type multidrug transport system fused ATPase/permease subunit